MPKRGLALFVACDWVSLACCHISLLACGCPGPCLLSLPLTCVVTALGRSCVQDELREREQEVAGLVAANSRLQTQLEGLQTILVTRVSQANRLTQELKDATKQLRQAEAAAVSDHAVLQQQLEQLSEKVLGLQDALAAGKQREQQLEAQLAATRGKVRAGLQDGK